MVNETAIRYEPGKLGAKTGYEHLHRYLLAASVAANKTVLDLASGEGYGCALLARYAKHVTGVELDSKAVDRAATRYGNKTNEYVCGSITKVPISNRTFDLITCFEALEHIQEQEELCREAKRLLAPGGTLLISTPNIVEYTQKTGIVNPYHVRELTLDEFRSLLGRHFTNIKLFGQRVHAGSHMWELNANDSTVHSTVPHREFVGAHHGEGPTVGKPSDKQPLYYVAACSQETPIELPSASTFLDTSDLLEKEYRAVYANVWQDLQHERAEFRRVQAELLVKEREYQTVKSANWHFGKDIQYLQVRIDQLTAALQAAEQKLSVLHKTKSVQMALRVSSMISSVKRRK